MAAGQAAAPVVGRILEQGERVIYHLVATEPPAVTESFGLGLLAYRYYRAALVLTDRRLIEVLLEPGGRRAATRHRSFAWLRAQEAKLFFGTLTIKKKVQPGAKEASVFKWGGIPKKDRNILKDLLEKTLKEAPRVPLHSNKTLPQWQCPACGAPISPADRSCAACKTPYRSKAMAAALALAFPGAGLFYTKRYWLGLFALLGELAVVAAIGGLLVCLPSPLSSPAPAGGAVGALALSKLWSIHLSKFFAARLVPIAPKRRWWWVAAAVLGVPATLGLFVLPVRHAGEMAPVVDRDVAFEGGTAEWAVSREPGQWKGMEDAQGVRSVWTHPEGWQVVVRATALQPWEFFRWFERNLREGKWWSVSGKALSPAGIAGTRVLRGVLPKGSSGKDAGFSHYYYLYDEQSRDVHEIRMDVPAEESDAARKGLEELLQHLQWIPAAPADGAAAQAQP